VFPVQVAGACAALAGVRNGLPPPAQIVQSTGAVAARKYVAQALLLVCQSALFSLITQNYTLTG